MADRIMTIIIELIRAAGKTSTVLEDAFLVVGSLASGKRHLSFITGQFLNTIFHRSPRGRLLAIYPGVPAIPIHRSQSARRYPTVHGCRRHYR